MSSLILVSIQLVFLATAINAWHKTVKFNFTVNDISDSHVNVFESSYLENDYFSMISSNRNNHMDMDSQSVYVGGRNHLYQLGLPDLEHQSVRFEFCHFCGTFKEVEMNSFEIFLLCRIFPGQVRVLMSCSASIDQSLETR